MPMPEKEKEMRRMTRMFLAMDLGELEDFKEGVKKRLRVAKPGRERAVAVILNDFVSTAIRKREFLEMFEASRARAGRGPVQKPADEGLRTAKPVSRLDSPRCGAGEELKIERSQRPPGWEDWVKNPLDWGD
jgi:hypothetical protein